MFNDDNPMSFDISLILFTQEFSLFVSVLSTS
jgi:hypothetical protein